MKNRLEEKNNEKNIKHIISKTDSYIGLNSAKEVLQNIEKYYEVYGVRKHKEYNIIISIKSEYALYMDLIEIIRQMYIELGIISKDSKYLYVNMNNNSNDFLLKDIKEDEEIVLIDMLECGYYIEDYKYKIEMAQKAEPKKIYIILENARKGKINSLFINDFQWYFQINEISIEDKEKYIKDFLMKNEIKTTEKWITELSKEPFYSVKSELTNTLVECQLSDKWEVIEKEKQKENKKNEKSGLEELNALMGIETVKNQILKIVNYLRICKNRANMPMLHMCFNGNPGTGKTTVARIVAKIFAEEEFLSSKEIFIETQRADLIGKYVGQTAPLTKENIDKARGGVLFIDEAYTLGSYIQDEAGRDYGAECIATLIKGMEDYRNELCVILAGYTKEMNHLLKTNPGFRSRIQFKIEFPDYSKEELYQIFEQLCKKENYRININVKKLLLEHFEVARTKNNFSNARYVRNIFEKVKIEQANRVIKDNKNKNNILKLDIQNVINDSEEMPEVTKKIGFIA